MSDNLVLRSDEPWTAIDLLSASAPLGPNESHSATLACVHLSLGPRIGEPHRCTTVAELLVRPHYLVTDESGEHSDESFYRLLLTREQIHALAQEVDQDWEDHMRACGTDRFKAAL